MLIPPHFRSRVVVGRPLANLRGRSRWGDAEYILQQPAYVQLDLHTEIQVPVGTRTDFASVPRLLRWFIGRVGPWTEASIVHDAAYRGALLCRTATASELVDEAGTRYDAKDEPWRPLHLSRRAADRLLLGLMADTRVLAHRRWSIYAAVRLFGWLAWRGAPASPAHGVEYRGDL